jgi:hypothetical protein
MILLLVFGFISCNKSEDDDKVTTLNDSLSMGAGYASDIYYSFSNGIVGSAVPRNNWDIGFKSNPRSSSVIVNSTMGVKLWQYPGDTTTWNAMDTSGLKSWPVLLDSDTTWSLSAFEVNQTGHPDYGWGEYNSINHDVIGKALFVMQLPDKSFKKIWIKKRTASANIYTFTYADLNGNALQTKSIPTGNYLSKNYVYFKFSTGEIVDREPLQTDWDVVLTKYYEMVYNGGTQRYEPYNVTGFLQNEGVTVSEVQGDVASNNYSGQEFDTSISVIGSDWKAFDNNSMQWSLKPDTRYFVQTKNKSIYKLVFKKFEGSSTGKVVFEKTKLK